MNALPRWVDLVVLPLVNVALGLLASGLVVLAIGENPLRAVSILVEGAVGSPEGVGYTLFYATDFIFTGLGVAVAFHAGLFNIGGDGQATLAGLGVTLACLSLPGWPLWLVLPAGLLAAMAFGAAWALIPAYLQARRGSHVVITTIMFNFIASALMVYLLVDVLKPVGTLNPESAPFPPGALLPKLAGGLAAVNLSFPIALVTAFLVWLLIWKTRLGYAIRTVGQNARGALYAGISPARITVIAMLLSGGVSGLMAINPLMGDQGKLSLDFTSGAGFVGIAVALMGRGHPVGILLAALLFGALYQGGAELAFDMPKIDRDMILIIQGMVVLAAGALENMLRPLLGRVFAIRLQRA